MRLIPAVLACLAATTATAANLVLVSHGKSRAPIVVSPDAPPEAVAAANELAGYLWKISGARPAVLTGTLGATPPGAIWVGLHPRAQGLFPDLKLQFDHPEEILLACNGRHLVIAGRDRAIGSERTEHGTANAVYTFVEKYLDVRWLWPGELGEDIRRRKTISVAPFVHRFHPPFRQRAIIRASLYNRYEAGKKEAAIAWSRSQRIHLDSLRMDAGHPFSDWWDRYHEEHPEYFALQPDGTRSGYPEPRFAKLCDSNPRVRSQFLKEAEELLRDNPSLTVLNAAPNDGATAGYCVCPDCEAWDHPDGVKCVLNWKDRKGEHVALTDRHMKIWNLLAEGLTQLFPDREVYVGGWAYGPALRPPPVAEMPGKHLVIGFVGHFPLANDRLREEEKSVWKLWAAKAPRLVFRPNLFWYSGGMSGLPTIATRRTLEDFRFLAENRGAGLNVDSLPLHWATQGVQYYLMAQLAWDPLQNGRAVLQDYYHRGFGPAAGEVERYFDLMEQAHDRITETSGWRPSMGLRFQAIEWYQAIYTDALLQQARVVLDTAHRSVATAPKVYRDRVAFVRAGLEFIDLQMRIMRVMAEVRRSGGRDRQAVRDAAELCRTRDDLFSRHGEDFALNSAGFRNYSQYRKMEDHLGPPAARFRQAAGID